jgi:hypothetical protein
MDRGQSDLVKALGLTAASSIGAPVLMEALSQGYYRRAQKETDPVVSTDPRVIAKKKALIRAHGKEVGGGQLKTVLNPERNKGGSYHFDDSGSVDELHYGPQASQFVLAHELGHRSINMQPGLMQQVQQKTYGGVLHPLIQTGAQIAAGAFAPSTRRALAYGAGMGYLNQLGTIASEVEATRRGAGYLEAAGTQISPAMHAAQLASYGVGTGLEAVRNVAIGRGLRALAGQLK